MDLKPWHKVEENGQVHPLADLPLGKEPPIPMRQDAVKEKQYLLPL
jgi:hypothetical protein